MQEMTNRQLWVILKKPKSTQEGMEAAWLLEERGERSEQLFSLKKEVLNRRLDELSLEEEKENHLLPKIAAFFFLTSSLLLIASILVLLYKQHLDYLLGVPKFILISVLLMIMRAFFVYKASIGIAWARYMILYGVLILYTLVLIIGYPGIFRFIMLEDLYFGVTFLTHLLLEVLAIVLVFRAYRG